MAVYRRFEELPVWQEAARLYHASSQLLRDKRLIVSSAYRQQLDRAALSISNNIAEGFERVTTTELLRYLAIARGSAGEVRSMMALAALRPDLGPVHPEIQRIHAMAFSCARQLNGWIISTANSPRQGKRHREARDMEWSAQP